MTGLASVSGRSAANASIQQLSGQLIGTTLSIVSSENVHATGTVNNGMVSGTFTSAGGFRGTFTGSSNNCR